MEGFDIFITVLAFVAMIVITVSKSQKKQQKQQQKSRRIEPRTTRPSSPQEALEELRRMLEDAEDHSFQVEDGIETYMEPASVESQPLNINPEEGVRSTVAVKDEKYSIEQQQTRAERGVKVDIDPRNLIIYSEIMRPKWEEY